MPYITGQTDWSMSRDEQGYRTYKAKFLVRSNYIDGPATISQTPGLPIPGSAWSFGTDYDLYVWCRFDATFTPKVASEKNRDWICEFTFSNKPGGKRCNDTPTGDPIFEPQIVNGTFVKYTEEATFDLNGNPLRTSAYEPLKGPSVEFDKNRPQVEISQNVLDLQLGLCASMVDTVNDSPLWGLNTRCIKLSDFSWERKYQGLCYPYYTRKFKFDIRYESFDRYVLDEGTMVKRGKWDKDPKSLTYKNYVLAPGLGESGAIFQGDIIRYKDWNGENANVILGGYGRPWDPDNSTTGTGDDVPGQIFVQKYAATNFLLLNIPIVF
jgi:hypothetical protein